MRSKGQVAHKLKQAVHRAIQREVRNLTRRTGPSCTNNREVTFGTGAVRVCALDCQKCDPVLDDRAPECPDYTPRATEPQIRKSLREFLKTRPPQDLAARFPDIASLLWVLANGDDDDQRGHLMLQAEPALKLWGVAAWADTPEDRQTLQGAYLEGAVTLKAAQAKAERLQADLDAAAEIQQQADQKDSIIRSQERALAASEKALREADARAEEHRRAAQVKSEALARLQGELEDFRAAQLPAHQDPPSWWRRFLSWF